MIHYFQCEECKALCNIAHKVEAIEHEMVWRDIKVEGPKGGDMWKPSLPPIYEKQLVEREFKCFICPDCADALKLPGDENDSP